MTWKSNSERRWRLADVSCKKIAVAERVHGSSFTEEKDLGIPNSFPFKDQLLQEAADQKARVRRPFCHVWLSWTREAKADLTIC